MENIEFSDWLKEHYDQKPHKQTREEKRAQHDREIMDAFCNFIRADTPEHQSYIRDGGCDIGYLGSHAKKACIPKWKFLRKVTRLFSFERDPLFLSKMTRLS